MTAVALEDALDRIRPECRRAPTDLMTQTLRDVARDFCQITRAYIYEVDSESVVALVSDYDIEMPNLNVEPVAVEFLQVDGSPSYFKDVSWLDCNISDWRYRSANDFRYFTQVQPRTITFPCVPTTNGSIGGVKYRVSIKPTTVAASIDDSFLNEWIEALSDGTKARLKAMPGESWSEPQRAATLEAMYRHARGMARIRVQKSFGNAALRWSGPKFAGK